MRIPRSGSQLGCVQESERFRDIGEIPAEIPPEEQSCTRPIVSEPSSHGAVNGHIVRKKTSAPSAGETFLPTGRRRNRESAAAGNGSKNPLNSRYGRRPNLSEFDSFVRLDLSEFVRYSFYDFSFAWRLFRPAEDDPVAVIGWRKSFRIRRSRNDAGNPGSPENETSGFSLTGNRGGRISGDPQPDFPPRNAPLDPNRIPPPNEEAAGPWH